MARRLLGIAMTVLLALLLMNTPAHAATTWTITGHSGSWSATGPVTVKDGSTTVSCLRLSGPGCTATATGAQAFAYDDSTAVITLNSQVGSGLVLSGVSGCLGLLHNGDQLEVDGQLIVSPSTLRITSP
jgi:hypothetical protein